MLWSKPFLYQYALDATTYKYPRLGDSMGNEVQGKWGAITAGSSTTVTSQADGFAFAPVVPGAVIVFRGPTITTAIRKVATKVSPTEITVDAAVTLTADPGVAWGFLPWAVGTTDADGWHQSRNDVGFSIFVDVGTLGAPGVAVTVQGLLPGSSTPVDLIPDGETVAEQSYAAEGVYELKFTSPVQAVRLGVKAVTSAAGGDSISAWLVERNPKVSG